MPAWLGVHDAARPALADGARCLDFGALARAVDAERDWLAASGARRVGLFADNGCPWVIADLALADAALPNVPLPAFFTPAQLAHACDDAGLDALLVDDPRRAEPLAATFAPVATAPGSGLTLWRRRAPCDATPLPAGTIKITYTSGSTGAPRGICLDAATLDAVALAVVDATRAAGFERHLSLLPLATLLENVAGVYAALRLGACCHVPPTARTGLGYGGLDVPRLLAAIDGCAPSTLILVPELLRVLVAAVERGYTPPASLRFVAVGGAVVARELLDRAARAGLPVFEGYGLSECASVVSLNTPGASRPGSVGRPLPHARVRIDADGEIHVAGAVMRGRLGDDTPPPVEIATGDLGSIDADGFLYVRGRRRNVLITSLGRNVSPEWVEGELVQESAVAHACVFGEARPHLVALLTPLAADIPPAALDRAVRNANARLPDYARVQRFAIVPPFTPRDGTLTANGRVRRDAVARRDAAIVELLYAAAPRGRDTPTLEATQR